MREFGRSAWRDPMRKKALYRLTERSFTMRTLYERKQGGLVGPPRDVVIGDRIGTCWAKGRLRPGDIVLVTELSGDCFYDCYLMEHVKYGNRPGVTMSIVPHKFGMYAFDGVLLEGMTDRDYHLLLAGETVEVALEERE